MTDARTIFANALVLAPMTKGSNLPYRRLCRELGADVTVGEMAVAKFVAQKRRGELALLRTHPADHPFGAQLADRHEDTLETAAKIAQERGADFVDLNCGCPIDEFTRKGLGAALLQHPAKFARLVAALRRAVTVPITVKLRLGWVEEKKNFLELARLAVDAGADAIALHGRTREQRYTKAADWDAIGAVVRALKIPVIGNGDIGTWYEARDLWARAGCAAVMVGRAALMKPWIFREIEENRGIEPGAEERVGIYFQFAKLLKEHFRDDEKGRKRTMFFLPWHLGFFCRYRPLPEAQYREASRQHPLLQTRMSDPDDLPLLERVLRDPREEVHAAMAAAMWDAADAGDLIERFLRIGQEHPPVAGEAGEVAVAHG